MSELFDGNSDHKGICFFDPKTHQTWAKFVFGYESID